jgi:DNA-binding beta-propeller fold protein YncE
MLRRVQPNSAGRRRPCDERWAAIAAHRNARQRVGIWPLVCLAVLLAGCASTGESDRSEAAKEYIFIPAPPETPRLQFLASYSTDLDVLPPLSGFRRFIVGDREGSSLGKPYGVAIHDGQILVCDTKAAAVAIFDLVNREFEVLGLERNGRLRKPVNIAVDEDGTRYVADTSIRRIMVYDANNHFVRALGEPDSWVPSDVAVIGKRLYVADLQGERVLVLEKATGQVLMQIGGSGSEDRERLLPSNLTVSGDRDVYVADTGNARVLRFDSRGNFLQQFGSLGLRVGQFVRPKGIAVDRENRLYVADASSEVVQIFNPEGKLLLFFGGRGKEPGNLILPAKVVIDYDHVDLFADEVAPGHEIEYLVIVTSQYGPRLVNVFGFLKQPDSRND